jgi:glycosyltransferase involved in cell wall biosynthesis
MVEQTHSPIELIVVDDHSPTPVQEVLERSNIDLDPITVHRHDDNKGGNAARNTGVDLASGDYLAFLDDDDEWVKTKIERQLQYARNTEAGVVYTGVEQVSNGKTVATKTSNVTGDVTIDLLKGNFIGTFSTILMRQDLVEAVGYPDDEFPSWHDWDYYLRLSEETTFEAVSEPLVRRHSDGQEQLSHDHTTKRDVTVPLFLDKHRSRADKYDVRSEFEATIAAEIGWSAVANDEFNKARRHYFRSFRQQPSKEALLFLALTIGGGWTFRPSQKN